MHAQDCFCSVWQNDLWAQDIFLCVCNYLLLIIFQDLRGPPPYENLIWVSCSHFENVSHVSYFTVQPSCRHNQSISLSLVSLTDSGCDWKQDEEGVCGHFYSAELVGTNWTVTWRARWRHSWCHTPSCNRDSDAGRWTLLFPELCFLDVVWQMNLMCLCVVLRTKWKLMNSPQCGCSLPWYRKGKTQFDTTKVSRKQKQEADCQKKKMWYLISLLKNTLLLSWEVFYELRRWNVSQTTQSQFKDSLLFERVFLKFLQKPNVCNRWFFTALAWTFFFLARISEV